MCAGAKPEAADSKGRSGLHLAVGCSSKMVEKLLALSVPVDATDANRRTALHYAALKGQRSTPVQCAMWCRDKGYVKGRDDMASFSVYRCSMLPFIDTLLFRYRSMSHLRQSLFKALRENGRSVRAMMTVEDRGRPNSTLDY